ncbi:hypothetical protein ALT_6592 [Aspergillus lentulus]|uniref:Uncharacterized protein n=1 Tax=Aspergillus lentulus TaxID=293939 RepID=A0AAN4PLZ2_ASPLE|nr:hypothetical protein CNMCM6936_007837 [Aspergillus lentulus]GAQ09271.1 hypothetical protein ALT_6592 [Aspergillus lentulus]
MAIIINSASPDRKSPERHYLEEEPNSAPQLVAHPQQPSPFPPGHNEKYFVNKEGQTQWTTETGPQFVAADTAEPKKKKRWRWIVIAVGVFALIVVAAVVGGVLGSRAAHKNDNAQSDSALSSSPTPSASSLSGTDTTTPSITTTISNNPTSTTTSPSSSATTDSNNQSANDGSTRLATFEMYETDSCGGTDDSFAITSTGSQRCVLVPSNKRSIRVLDNSCIVTTWSGDDCKGLNFRVPDNKCHNVLYAAVSVYC